MTRGILVNFHLYTPFGKEFYTPILDFFLQQMKKYEYEYDHLYLLDSNWEIEPKKIEGMKASIIRTNPSMRYYDCFKEVLPQIKEDKVLFLDNDMVIYRPGIIKKIFNEVKTINNVVSIYDIIGEYYFEGLHGASKFCPYLFAAHKNLLLEFIDCDWGPKMPEYETLGLLTKEMMEAEVEPFEMKEDKSNLLFGDDVKASHSKDLGYYHIRSGSTPAVLLSWRNSPEHKKTYQDYIKAQPRSEILRQFAWYYLMSDKAKYYTSQVLMDLGITSKEWIDDYITNFEKFHGL